MATGFATEAAGTGQAGIDREESNLYRLNVAQYLTMVDAGVFDGGPAVELLGGLLVEKMTKNDPHDFGVDKLSEQIRRLLPEGWIVRQEKSLMLDARSRPETDIVVARGPRDRYRNAAPRPKDVALVIEVADSSYSEDRGSKWSRYAAAKIPVYGILNIRDRRFELYRKPQVRDFSAGYGEALTFDEAAELPIVISRRELGRIAVRDVLA